MDVAGFDKIQVAPIYLSKSTLRPKLAIHDANLQRMEIILVNRFRKL